MATIHAIYENGVFRPLEPVDLPEGSKVDIEPRIVTGEPSHDMDAVYEILDRRHSTGEADIAERHNEHQL